MHRLAHILLIFAACTTVPPPPPEPPAPGDVCDQAEANLRTFPDCPEALGSMGPDGLRGTSDDRSFAQECRLLEQDFPGLVQPRCIAQATSCDAARLCAGE